MKKAIIIMMNMLFLLVVAADVVSVKYDCNVTPVVQKSCYHKQQAMHYPHLETDMISMLK